MRAWLLDGQFIPEPLFVEVMAVRWHCDAEVVQKYIEEHWVPNLRPAVTAEAEA
jgi:hypothetical protein